MARIINPLFGNLSGRVGDFVFMTKNGKTFMYFRPKSEKKQRKSNSDEYQKGPNTPFSNIFKKPKNPKQTNDS